MALNGTLVIRLGAAVDPLSVTRQSVVVAGDDAMPLQAEVGVERGALAVRLVVGPELLAHPPARLEVRLAGAPSLHALRTVTGGALAGPARLSCALRPRLEAEAEVPRLVEIQGREPAPIVDVGADGLVVLVFDGVLDPDSVTPEQLGLRAVHGGLVLPEPVLPEVTWTCTGRRFVVELRVATDKGPLQLALRRSGLRGLSGRAPEPALLAELRSVR